MKFIKNRITIISLLLIMALTTNMMSVAADSNVQQVTVNETIDELLTYVYTQGELDSLLTTMSERTGRAVSKTDLVGELTKIARSYEGAQSSPFDTEIFEVFFSGDNLQFLMNSLLSLGTTYVNGGGNSEDLARLVSAAQTLLFVDEGAVDTYIFLIEDSYSLRFSDAEKNEIRTLILAAYDFYREGEAYRLAGNNVFALDAYEDALAKIYESYDAIYEAVYFEYVYLLSNDSKDDYLELSSGEMGSLRIQAQTTLDKSKWLFVIKGENGNEEARKSGILNGDGSMSAELNLSGLDDGNYKYTMYYLETGASTYWSNYYAYPLVINHGCIVFEESVKYADNRAMFEQMDALNPSDHDDINDVWFEELSHKEEIVQLAESITSGAATDYEKLKRIHDYVAETIYYDYDALTSGVYGAMDAYGTYSAKRSVCQGYAELTDALLKSVGIPSLVVSGQVLHQNSQSWDDLNDGDQGHAWNAAYINGDWILLDTTWDSGNDYRNGNEVPGNMTYAYFEQTLEMFSYDHWILRFR